MGKSNDPHDNLRPPSGTRIRFLVEQGAAGRIEIPRPRLGVNHLAFLGLFVGFVAVVVRIGLDFPPEEVALLILFILIFAAIGFLYGGGFINAAFGRQVIRLSSDEIRIEKIRPFFPRQYVISYSSIERVGVENVVPKTLLDGFNLLYVYLLRLQSDRSGRCLREPVALPTISHAGRRTHFAENATEEERTWLVAIISTAASDKRTAVET